METDNCMCMGEIGECLDHARRWISSECGEHILTAEPYWPTGPDTYYLHNLTYECRALGLYVELREPEESLSQRDYGWLIVIRDEGLSGYLRAKSRHKQKAGAASKAPASQSVTRVNR